MPIVPPYGRPVGLYEPVDLKLAIGFATADAAVLFQVPSDVRLAIERVWWEVVTGFTGGTSSAIGVSSSATGYTTKGDLLGGSGGDVAATLVAGHKGGTIGTDFGSNGVIVLPGGSTLRFDRIASVFTAGAGFVRVLARQIQA